MKFDTKRTAPSPGWIAKCFLDLPRTLIEQKCRKSDTAQIPKKKINNVDLFLSGFFNVHATELYYITGGSARGKKCRQKHGGFQPLLTQD